MKSKITVRILVGLLMFFSSIYQINATALVKETSTISLESDKRLKHVEKSFIANTQKESGVMKLKAADTNDLYVAVSNGGFINPLLPGFDIRVYNDDLTYDETLVSDNQLAVLFAALPYGDYNYTITKNSDCYEPSEGTITIDANGGAEEVLTVLPEKKTTNSVFFFIGLLQEQGCTINLTNGTTYNETIVGTGILGDYEFTDVPYGNYTYSVYKDCSYNAGLVTVSCNNNEGISVLIDGLEPIDNSVSQEENVLTANGTGMDYQWVDCDSGNPIDGATSQTYTATANGNYAVIISNLTCELTSDCVSVSNFSDTNDLYVAVSNGGFINPLLPGFDIRVYNNDLTYDETLISDNQLAVLFAALPYGDYNYTITKNSDCYVPSEGTITIDANGGAEEVLTVLPEKKTTNSVFFFIGLLQEQGCTINLTNGTTYNETIVGTGILGDYEFTDVPYGNYTYSVYKDCSYNAGLVTVSCNNNEGISVLIDGLEPIDNSVSQEENVLTANAIGMDYQWVDCDSGNPIDGATNQTYTATANGNYAVIISNLTCELTSDCINVSNLSSTNDLYVSVSNGGLINPLLSGFDIRVYNDDLTYDETQVSDNQLAVLFAALPYGDYNYTITKSSACYVPTEGTITIDANGGAEELLTVIPEMKTTNSVFFFIGSLQEQGCIINITNGTTYNETIVGTNLLGDYEFTDVPYGDYSYSVSKGCDTNTGFVTVDCNNNDGIGVIVTELTPLDTSVSLEGNILKANVPNMEYQWATCDNFTPIDGATSQIYVASQNGKYSVMITSPSCEQTSECIEVTSLSVSKNNKNIFSIYPNPVQNDLNIELSAIYKSTTVEIVNMIGQSVYSGKYFESNKINLNVSAFNSGVYFININADNKTYTKKFIKN